MRVEAARAVERRMEALVLVPGQTGLAHLKTCVQYSVVYHIVYSIRECM